MSRALPASHRKRPSLKEGTRRTCIRRTLQPSPLLQRQGAVHPQVDLKALRQVFVWPDEWEPGGSAQLKAR